MTELTTGELSDARTMATLLRPSPPGRGAVDLCERRHASPSAYGSDIIRRTYAALGRGAQERLAAGEHVIVDATFRFAADRQAFAGALGVSAGDAVWIECRGARRDTGPPRRRSRTRARPDLRCQRQRRSGQRHRAAHRSVVACA